MSNIEATQEASSPSAKKIYDTLIIGGGPAAMTAAVYAARKMLSVTVITDEFGGQMSETTEIENYMGFQMITGSDLVDKFVEHMKQFDIPIAEGKKVERIYKEDGIFHAVMEDGAECLGRTCIVATGKRYKRLSVPGEEEFRGRGVSYCEICDAPFFTNRVVVVAGGGNSAFTAALDLVKRAKHVTVINHSKGFKADKVLYEQVARADNVTFIDNHDFVNIKGEMSVQSVTVKDNATGEEKSIPTDGVFVEIGGIPNSDLVRDFVRLTEFGELAIDCHTRSSVEGLFGAGDVTTVPYKQIVVSAGAGATAALSAYDYLAENSLL